MSDNGAVVGHEHDEQQERWRREALHDPGHHQRLHGVEAQEVHAHGNQGKADDRRVEFFGLGGFGVEAVSPAQRLAQVVGGPGGHDGHGEEADRHEPTVKSRLAA